MSFDESLRQLLRRVDTYWRTGDATGILNDSATADAVAVLRAAQGDEARLASAHHAVGWLYFGRSTAQVPPAHLVELARAIVLLEPLADEPDAIPEPLRTVLGPDADPEHQFSLAGQLLQEFGTTDPYALDAAVGLQTAALTTMPADHPDRMKLLANLALAHFWRFESIGELADVDQAVTVFHQALAAAPSGFPERVRLLSGLGSAYARRFESTRVLDDADRAIDLFEQVLGAIPTGHPEQAEYLAKIGVARLQRFKHAGQAADLEQAIELWHRVVAATPSDDPRRASRLAWSATAHGMRYQQQGAAEDLDHTVDLYRQALASAPDDPGRPQWLSDLGFALLQRFQRGGVATDLDHGIDAFHQALATMAVVDPVRLTVLSDLASAHALRFRRTGEQADIDAATELGEQAMAVTPPGHPNRVSVLSNLVVIHTSRFDHTGVLADLDRAITLGHEALSPEDHPDRVLSLVRLGTAHRQRFEHAGLVTDLDEAIALGQQAVAAAAADHPLRAQLLSDLARNHGLRFERTGTPADLDTAITLHEQELSLIPAGEPAVADCLSNTGAMYLRRFMRTGVVADLDRSIDLCEQARNAAEGADRAVILANLGGSYLARYQHTGAPADLDRTIELCGQAADIDPAGATLPLTNLSLAHVLRFERTGVLADVDRAVEVAEQARRVMPDGYPDQARPLTNMGFAYRARFERTGVAADLDRGIELGEHILTLAASPVDRAKAMSDLGIAYIRRFERTDALADVDRAVELGEQAQRAMPPDFADRFRSVSNLGLAYLRRFGHSELPTDLDRAIDSFEQAVSGAPEDNPHRSGYLSNLSSAYLLRATYFDRAVDLETLAELVSHTATANTAPAAHQVGATSMVGRLAYAMNEYATAVRLFDAAVAMLPLVAPRESGWADQEHSLGAYTELVGDAVAAHCAHGDVTGAVEAAELSRGILLAAQLDSRTELTELDQAHPALAARFRHVRDRLNLPAGSAVREIEERRRLWREQDDLLAQIRQQAGFARFLRPPRLEDLRPAADGGAVVLVNAGSHRSDAIIVSGDTGPVHVPLPGLRSGDVQAQARQLLEATHDSTAVSGALRRRRVLPAVLGWLWDTIVEPVADALHSQDTGDDPLPRVWWLPVGLLGLFPLHAAGHPGQASALDRVVSSYTPSLRALAHSRTRPPSAVRRQLTVALTRTPGLPDLPGTAAEAAILHADQSDARLLTDQDATTARVGAALPTATWAHFACHANVDATTSSQSGLHLHDGTLLLSDISRLHLADAELAYLSACSTAHPGLRTPNEVLHLASAFQLAGYRHVIASLWPLNDDIAATAAAAFYERLPSGSTADRAAVALHEVANELRAQHPERPDLWAALVHSGA
nr:CHAT domain-containing tetratricopeptide repeat protein [Kibdelosporangium sp. MJ126-NF4]CEL13672.1 hypothetical protein [Kibdelosporangium sp. MJ126-NF4]